MSEYKISLGIGINQAELNNLKNIINTIESKERKIVYDIDFTINKNISKLTDVSKDIEKIQTQINNLGKVDPSNKMKSAVSIDTKTLEKSLNKVHDTIKKVKNSLGTVDSKKGVQSLLTTVNHMSKSLEKVSKQFEGLNKSLSGLSGKELSLNLDFGLNKAAKDPQQAIRELNMLQKEVQEYENYFRKFLKIGDNNVDPINRLMLNYNPRSRMLSNKLLVQMNQGSDVKRIGAYKEYINLIKETAKIGNISTAPVEFRLNESSEFAKLRNEANETERQLKELFSGGIDAQNLHRVLDLVSTDLNEIKVSLQTLAANNPIGELTQSFTKLSSVLDKLGADFGNFKNILGSGLGNNLLNSGAIQSAQQTGQQISKSIEQSAKQSFNLDSVIDKEVSKLMNSYQIVGDKGSKAFNDIRQAIVNYRKELSSANNSADIKKVTNTLSSYLPKNNEADEAYKTYKNLLGYIQKTNRAAKENGTKIHIPKEIKQEYKDDFRSMRSTLGAAFTTGAGSSDFETFINGLNKDLGQTISLSNGAEAAFGKLVNMVKSARSAKPMSSQELFNASSMNLDIAKKEIESAVNAINSSVNQEALKEVKKTFDYSKLNAYAEEYNKVTVALEKNNKAMAQGNKENISRLEAERSLLMAKKQELQNNMIAEQNIADKAFQQAKKIVEQRALESQQAQKTANDVVQSEATKQKAIQSTSKEYAKISKDTSIVGDKSRFKQIFEPTNQAAQEAKKHFQELLANEKAVVSVTERFDDSKSLQSFTVDIKRANGEVEKLHYSMQNLSPIKGEEDWYLTYSGAAASDRSVERQTEKQIKKANDLQIRLDRIKSEYSDINAAKPIKDSNHIKALDDQYKKIANSIIEMKNADSSTAASMILNIDKETAALQNLVREYKNAEAVTTALRSKDIATVGKTYGDKLEVLMSKIRTDGFDFKNDANNLRSMLSSAVSNKDKDGLISFLNGYDKLASAYKRAAAGKKELETTRGIGQSVSGLKTSIEGWQKLDSEIGKFKTEVNGAEVSVESLLSALDKVKTKGDLQGVRGDMDAFKKAAEVAGHTLTKTSASRKANEEAKVINDAFNQIYNTKKKIGSLEVDLIGAEAKNDVKTVKDINNEITRLKGNISSLDNNGFFSSQFTDKQNARLKELDRINDYGKRQAQNKIDYKLDTTKARDEIRKIDEAFNSIRKTQERIGKLEVDLIGAEAKNDVKAVKDINNEITRLKSNISSLDKNGVYSSQFTDKQKADLKELNELIDYSKRQAQNGVDFKFNAEKAKAEVKEVNDNYKQMLEIQKQIRSFSIKEKNLTESGGNANELDVVRNKLKELNADYKTLYNTFGQKLDPTQFGNLQAEIDQTKFELKQLDEKYADTKARMAQGIKTDFKLGNYDNQLSQMDDKFNQLSYASKELVASVNSVKMAYGEMRKAMINTGNKVADRDRLIQAEKKYADALNKTNNLIKVQARADASINKQLKLGDDIRLFQTDIDRWLKANSGATKEFKNRMLEMRNAAESADRVKLNGLIRQFKLADKQAEVLGVKVKSTFDRLKGAFSQFAYYMSPIQMFMYARMGLRSMFEQVKLIDSAMTELKKVTNETSDSYDKFLTNAAAKASEIGTTIDGLVESTASFARLGYGFEDAQGLAEVANIYAVVGDEVEGVEGATKSLISTMAAFKDEMNGLSNTDFALSIVDKINEVSNNFAISSGGLGEALQRSASSLAVANSTLDESIGLITAANTVTQNPDKVGNAMKTISMRIRSAKTELEEAGESTDGMVESTATLRKEIEALSGVDIMVSPTEFKAPFEILDELSKKWENLNDISQATIIEKMAGKHQGNVFSSLMENFDIARKAVETSTKSSGSAMKEHEKWQKSLEAQLLKVKAAWQGLSQSFLSSDFLKVIFDGIINLVKGLNKLADTFDLLPSLVGIFAVGLSAFKNIGIFKILNTDLGGFINTVGIANKSIAELSNAFMVANKGGIKGFISGISAMKNSLSRGLTKADVSNIKAYNAEIRSGTSAQTAWYRTMQTSSSAAQNLVASAKGGEVALEGMKTATIGSRIALIGAKAAAVAFNAAITMGISLLVSWAVSGIQKVINAKKNLAEEVENLTTKYKEQHEELRKLKGDYDTSDETSMISKYEKLSKGVDNLGRNVSLTADEYSEYQSIVNKIAGQIPSLVSGYDEQGNALLSVKGNVEELTKAYEKLIHAQNTEILSNSKKFDKDFKNSLKGQDGESWDNGHGFWASLWGGFDSVGLFSENYDLKSTSVSALKKLLNTSDKSDRNKIYKQLLDNANRFDVEEIRTALERANVDIGYFDDPLEVLEKTLTTDRSKIKGIVDNYYNQFADDVKKQKTIAQASLSEAFDVSSAVNDLNYENISEELQNIAYQTVNNLDLDFFTKLQEKGKTVEQWTKEMLNSLNSLSKADNKQIKTGFELETKFNDGDISYNQYISQLQETIDFIDKDLKVPKEVKNQIKLSLNSKDALANYKALVNDLENIGFDNKTIDKFFNSLSSEEFSAAMKVIPKLDGKTTIKEIQALIDEELAEEFKFDITAQTEGITAFNTALSESRSATGLATASIEALQSRYKDLEGFNAAALFEKTANGIHLNNEELSRLEEQYASTNQLNIDSNLNKIITKYNDLTEEIKNCTDAQEKENLQLQADAYKDRIDELSTLSSQYEGLTSAFSKWKTAQEGAEEGDNYDSLYENLKSIKELYKKGLVGTDKFKTAVQLMTNEDLTGANGDEIVDAYQKGYPKMQRYFTDGRKGCQNFLNDVQALNSEWAHMNKDGSWEINFNSEEVANELGVSVDFILQIAKKLKDFSFKVNFEDSSVDKLTTKIEQTEAKLKKLGQTPVDINVDVEATSKNLGTIESEIEKAKSKIKEINNSKVEAKVKTAQLEDAKAKLEALIDKKAEASQPAFMNLNTSQVSASLVDALEKIQSYQNAVNEVNKLNELKSAGIVIDDSQLKAAKGKIDEYAKAIQGLDGDVKVAIGLEKDGSINSIKKSFEEGKVKIDANTDPAHNKIEQLAENVEKIEDKDVTINVKVDGLDKVKELNKQINLATDIDGDIDELSDYVKSAKDLSKLDNNITTYVSANIKGNVTETPEFKINNLELFADSVKDLEDIGSFTTTVKADVKGNVIDTDEDKFDNLKAFSDNAKDVGKIGNVESTVKADVKGNVIDTFEYQINNLKTFTDNAKDINKIGDVNSTVDANIKGNVVDTFEYKINNLKTFTDNAKDVESIGDVESTVNANVKGNVINTLEGKINNLKAFSDNAKDVKKIGKVESTVDANIKGNVVDTFEYKINNLKTFTDNAKDIKKIGNVESVVKASIEGNVVNTLEGKINNLKVFTDNAKDISKIGNVESKVNANIKGNVVDTLEGKINNLKVFTDNAKDIGKIGNVESTVKASVEGNIIDTREGKIDNLKVFYDSAKNIDKIGNVESKVSANIEGNVIDTREGKIDNLEVFYNSAKNLKNIGIVTSDITANVKGNVIDTKEDKIDNLKVFSDSAKNLQNIGTVTSDITANIKGNVIDTREGKIDNLKVFYDSAKNIGKIGDVNSVVTANVKGNVIDTLESKINNLKVFTDNAKDIKNIGDVESTVKADVKGSVIDTKEYKINNLKMFSDSAKNINKIGDVKSTVDANVKGNVIDTREGKIDNLKVFYDSAKNISKIGDVKSTVNANVKGNVIDTREGKIDNLKVFYDSAKNIGKIGNINSTVNANVKGNVIDTREGKIDNLKVFANSAKDVKNIGSFTSDVTANVSGNVITDDSVNTNLEHFASIVSGMSNQAVTVSVTAKVDSENVNKAIQLLKDVSNSGVFKDYNATVQVGAKIAKIDDTTVQKYKAPPKEGKVSYSVDPKSSVFTWTSPDKDGVVNYDAEVEALTDAQKHKRGTITYDVKFSGFPLVNGTANVNGTAFANGTSGKAYSQGDWGTKKTTTALTGELGRELVVYKNRYWTVGDNGAEFATIPKGAIVFNHKQTEELFKNGKVTSDGGRGVALASGTAFLGEDDAVIGGGSFYGDDNSSSNSSKKSSSKKSSSKKSSSKKSSNSNTESAEEFKEVLDWIEIALKRVQREIDKLDQKANNVYKSWTSRNTALSKEIGKVGSEINLQQQAYNRYMKEANNVGLSAAYKKKVQNGTIDIQTIKDENLKEKIDEYQQWYEKALDCKDTIEELKETEASLYRQRFDNVQTQYDAVIQGYEHTETMLNEYISQAETKGHIVSKKYYNELINNENNNISKLKQEQSALIKARDEAVASGAITKYSEDWYNMCNEIDSVTQAIEESTTALLEYDNAMREIDWSVFDLIQERISAVSEEADFLIELMSSDKLYDDKGKLTGQGAATMGLHAQKYNAYMYQADDYGAEVAELDKQIAKDPYDQELINRRKEILELQREMILNAQQEKEAIRDLVEEGINLELEALQELIDKKNEELESEKDLYEYQKKVKEQTEEIASLEKQMAAYSGDDSEEAKAKVQELKVSLEEAKTELQETEWDKYISDTSALLDDLYNEYELILNQRLDNIDYLLQQVVDGVNADGAIASALGVDGAIANAIVSAVGENGSINSILNKEATSVGTTLSNAMNNIWSTGEGNAKSILTTYGQGFQDKLTTTNITLDGIKVSVNNMVSALNKEAEKKTTANKTSTSAKKDPTKDASTNKKTTTNTKKTTSTTNKTNTNKSSGDGVPKKGDKVKFVSGQYYYDSYGKKPLGSKYQGKEVYITNINKSGSHPYHISTGKTLGKGDLGWLKLNQISGYATGKRNFLEDEIAWTQENGKEFIVRPSDGAVLTPIAKGDSVLNANASNNIWDMANNPSEFIKDNLNLGTANVPNNSNVNNNVTQNFENVVFSMPNVHSYNELLSQMAKDKDFEKLILSMSVDRLAGKSSLAKGKLIR